MTRRRAAFAGAVALAFVVAAAAGRAQAPDGWTAFDGSWSATGTRHVISTERGTAAIVKLSGAIVLAEGPAGGFSADMIGFDAGNGTATGRAVWTDSRGDRVFSTLQGGPIDTGRRIVGTITGGTGRWSGATGDYSLTWQYVVADGDIIQGRAADLVGRIRVGTAPR